EKRNALDAAARSLLGEVFQDLDGDSSVRVVVLTGAGTAFCPGTDLTGPARASGTSQRPVAPVDDFSQPIIEAVHGAAAGGGFEFALACDLRVASPTARFLLPEVRIGSLPGSGGTQRIFDALPAAIAWKVLLSGQALLAGDALRFGLVSDVFDEDAFSGQ